MYYNPYLYHANPQLPNRCLYADADGIPSDILRSLIPYILSLHDPHRMRAMDIYEGWRRQAGIRIMCDEDLVLQCLDFIGKCTKRCDLNILGLLAERL